MWIKRDDGSLINADHANSIHLNKGKNSNVLYCFGSNDDDYYYERFETDEEAEARFKELELDLMGIKTEMERQYICATKNCLKLVYSPNGLCNDCYKKRWPDA